MTKLVTKSEEWLLAGLAEHAKFLAAFKSAKEAALNAGFYFLSAKAECKHGDFELWAETLFQSRKFEINIRTVRRYCEFATECLEWAKSQKPSLNSAPKLQEAARELVLHSPKGYVALCRELQLMRKFGEYDAIRYATGKDKPEAQLFFSFETQLSNFKAITGRAPEFLKLAPSSLDTLERETEASLAIIRARKLELSNTGRSRGDEAQTSPAQASLSSLPSVKSEQLWTCPLCHQPNFLLQGLKAHRCPANDGKRLDIAVITELVTSTPAIGETPSGPSLSSLPSVKSGSAIRVNQCASVVDKSASVKTKNFRAERAPAQKAPASSVSSSERKTSGATKK